jgi:Hint domain
MQELEVQFAKARFARRHFSKVAGIGLAVLIARLAMPTPARAQRWDDHDHDRDDHHYDDHHFDDHHFGDPGPGGHCFLKGTRVRTITGERAVEDLAVGDLLPTHFNGIQPIQWIGRYRYTRSDMSKPWVRAVLPVRVARSALASNVPHSDLYLSQPHSIFIDDELVCVGSLVNGATIALHDAGDLGELEYYHIKLQSHDIIHAEGAPCETLLHVDESAVNFVEYLRMYGAPSEWVRPCVPIRLLGNRSRLKSHLRSALSPWVDRREKIDIIRDRLEDRALTMA